VLAILAFVGLCAAVDTAIESYYDALMYPNQIPILEDPDLALDFVNPNIYYRNRGSVMVQGYEKFVDNSLGGSPYETDAIGRFSSYSIRRIVANGNVTAITVDIAITPTTLGQQLGLQASTITDNAYFVLDTQGKIIQYDALTENFDSFWIALGVDYSNSNVRASTIAGICAAHDEHCNGNDDQFNGSGPNCSTYLNTLPTGAFADRDMDNIACRASKQGNIGRNPGLYCPLVGTDTDPFCNNDNTYLSYYDNNDFFPYPFIAE